MLGELGHQVTTLDKEAPPFTSQLPFDLILMDSSVPLTATLSARAAMQVWDCAAGIHVPIIAMTEHAMNTDRERCIANGIDHYVAHPHSAAELENILSSVSDPESIHQNARPANWDRHLALQHAGGDERALQAIVNVYNEEKLGLLAKMNLALKFKQAGVLEWAALKLAEKLTYLGAAELSGMAREIAFFGRKKKFAKTSRLAAIFQSHMLELDSAMVRLHS
jgi:CheY-like chemotaxis protein